MYTSSIEGNGKRGIHEKINARVIEVREVRNQRRLLVTGHVCELINFSRMCRKGDFDTRSCSPQ